MNPLTALVAIEKPMHLRGKSGPVALQNPGVNEVLKLQTAQRIVKPVDKWFKA